MKEKIPAFTTEAPTTVATTTQSTVEENQQPEADEGMTDEEEESEEDKEEQNKEMEGSVQCDSHTSCPQATTCCFMASSQKWGCCPLPEVSAATSPHQRPPETSILKFKPALTRNSSPHGIK